MGKEQNGNDGLNAGGSSKQKQPPKAMANFFMPISKRTKVAAEVVVDAKKEEMPASEVKWWMKSRHLNFNVSRVFRVWQCVPDRCSPL